MGLRRRHAWGKNVRDGIALLEWELGARVAADILSENHRNRMVVRGALKVRCFSVEPACLPNEELARKFCGSYLQLKGDDKLYFCHAIHVDGRLVCSVDWPNDDPKGEEATEWWYVDPSLILWSEELHNIAPGGNHG